MRRPNSFISPPQINMPPLTTTPIAEIPNATGPVIELTTLVSGVSHSVMPPVVEAANASCGKALHIAKMVKLSSQNGIRGRRVM
jgi:hypothetical protein